MLDALEEGLARPFGTLRIPNSDAPRPFGSPPRGIVLRPQDVFQTLLRPANTMQAAINALPFSADFLIDKDRVAATDWSWRDSATGLANTLASNTTAAQAAFGGYSGTNNRVVQALKQAPKFFQRVTYTGDGTSGRQIPHGLGVKPGMIIVKSLVSSSYNWWVYHASIGAGSGLLLNATDASSALSALWNNTEPTASAFTLGTYNQVNQNGGQYVAYLFAHDPDTSGIVQCGSGNATLPWAPQWVLYKDAGAASDWRIQDAARGFTPAGGAPSLAPNLSAAEAVNGALTVSGSTLTFSGSTTPVWCAIRASI